MKNCPEKEVPHSSKYKYSSLNELSKSGEYNFYGIILDSSFPVQIKNNEKEEKGYYECSLKIIDPHINCINNKEDFNEKVINVIIKASDKENIPFIHCVGDIIRVHRGIYNPKKKRNVYINLLDINKVKGSCCIFKGASNILSDDLLPSFSSHINYTFELQDKNIITNLRNWIEDYFSREGSIYYEREKKLDERIAAGSDNDAMVQVVKKFVLNDHIVYFVQDDSDGCELHVYKYFEEFKEDDVIRVRSYRVYDKNVIYLNNFGNLLKIPKFTYCYKKFMNNLARKLKEIEPIIDKEFDEKWKVN